MLSALLTAALVAGTGDPVVARADGEAITAAQVTARAEELGLPALAALETTIKETLLAHAATAEGLAHDPEVHARLEAERRGEAEAVLARLRAGGALLDEAKGSPDPVLQAKSGVLGWVERGELAPALAQAAFSVPLDTPMGPISVPKGFAIIVVHERQIGSNSNMAAESAELRQRVELAKREPAVEQFLAKLRKQRHARVDSAFLERTGDRLDATAEDLERAVATAGALTVRYADVTGPLREVGDGTATARASAAAKRRLSWTLLDRKLLEEAAVSRGAHDTAQVIRALHRFERHLLAAAYVRKLGDEVRANVAEQLRRERAQSVIEARLARLRADARVVIDEAALAALVARTR